MGFNMDTAVAGNRPTSSALANSGKRRRPSQSEAEAAVRTLIEWAGEDPDREGLKGTPERVVRAYEEFFAGYFRMRNSRVASTTVWNHI